MSFQAITLAQYPKAYIDESTFVTQSFESVALKDGEFRVAVSHWSLDPAMRGWVSPDTESYIPPVAIGEVMRSLGVGKVVESNNEQYPLGSMVSGMTGWSEEIVSSGAGLSVVPPGVSPELALSALGMPGMTAYIGYADVLGLTPGQTLVVSGAAGAVGSVVVQMAIADGLNVIGSAGSDEKCAWLKSLGCHGVINYKTDDIGAKLDELAPKGVDGYFENTGGPLQAEVYARINPHARIAVCGLIADYHSPTPTPAPSWINLIKRRARIEGFTITDHMHRVGEIVQGLMPYFQAGQLDFKTHTLKGLESAKLGVNMLYKGENTGKLIVEL
ncbi:NADP-dependent oxidoreductase [Paraferrimonas sedimenticola]|uniref:NADP-dependent oxidoreductase n=1 Tax=Paraferrimonas sedimenticola TaxID=375674 RepID=A0AA37VUS7_9GAMM|nr:NADP-dependent oxidoreductase [Paraferrimonas sedimenticola]GLP95861.1 NADP-dependent oxidoreductase [Paraferrimonas sedimenticola]